MQELLPQLVAGGPVEPAPTGTSVKWGRKWRCPADGQRMKPEPGGVRCPDCGRRLLGPVIHELTEFNVHKKVRQ
jgi:tRNA(Ile2) C34 agmatinyltransferase TiaS